MPEKLSLFGYTVDDILDRLSADNFQRDLDAFEIFAGVGSIHLAALQAGLQSSAYDKEGAYLGHGTSYLPDQDFVRKEGFENAFLTLGRVREDGLMTAAPICSSFVFPNSSGHKRSQHNDYYGDMSKPYVVEGSNIAVGTAMLLEVAVKRRVHPLLENPPRSFIWKFPPMAETLAKLDMVEDVVVHHCAFDNSRAVGEKFWKEFRFVTCHPWVHHIDGRCQCGDAEHVKMMNPFIQADTGNAKCVGQLRTTGNKKVLRESQSYPAALGVAIVNAWQQRATPAVRQQAGPRPKHVLKRPAGSKPSVSKKRPSGAGAQGPSWQTVSSGSESDGNRHGHDDGSHAWQHPASGSEDVSEEGLPTSGVPNWMTPTERE